MTTYGELCIRTQYDGKDYLSVEGIYYFDADGDEKECVEGTNACIDISTCAHQGVDSWSWIKDQVIARLKVAEISYESIQFDDDRGN